MLLVDARGDGGSADEAADDAEAVLTERFGPVTGRGKAKGWTDATVRFRVERDDGADLVADHLANRADADRGA